MLRVKVIIGLCTMCIMGMILLVSSCVMVTAGHVGVQQLFGSVRNDILVEGIHFLNPFIVVEKMDARLQEYTMSGTDKEGKKQGFDAITALSQDGLNINLEITVWYRLIPDKAADIYRNIGINYGETVLRPAVRATVREEAAMYKADTLWGPERIKFISEITDTMKNVMRPKGIDIERVLLRDVGLPIKIKAAIEAKLASDQASQQMKFVLLKETQEAERKRIEAQGISDFQFIVTKGISEQLLKWKGIEATEKLAASSNAKIVIIGGKDGLPLILNTGN